MSYKLDTDVGWERTRTQLADCFRKWGVDEFEVLSARMGVKAEAQWQDETERRVTVRYKAISGQVVELDASSQSRAVDNLRLLYLALEAMRKNELRGIAGIVANAYLQLEAPMSARDPWEVLELRPNASEELVHAAYRTLAKTRHPDGGGSEAAFRELDAAYRMIIDKVEEERLGKNGRQEQD